MSSIKDFFKNKSHIILLICLFIIPLIATFIIIGFHSNVLVTKIIHYILLFLAGIILVFFIVSLVIALKNKNLFQTLKKVTIIILIICISLEWILASTFLILLYGPSPKFREWLIPTAMTTMNHQYLATWFYSQKEIDKVLDNNKVIESDDDTDLNLINIGQNNAQIYANEYEKEILKRDEKDIYKVVKVEGKGYSGFLIAIYDPARVGVGVTKYLNKVGQFVTEMAADEKAILAINGGGFIDPGHSSTGGTPHGVVIKNGKLLTNNNYEGAGGVIAFTKDNKMLLGKMNGNEALNKGVRDALTFGPFLIVNGKKSFIKGNGGWGKAPRTAIGQRQDGIVLFLVVDGRTVKNPGADMVELTEILSRYGAYNAANLDGGTSSVLVFKEEVAKTYLNETELKRNCRQGYCYINDPIDSGGSHETRKIATSFIVK